MEIREVPFNKIKLKSGLWKDLQDKNSSCTIYAVKDRFAESGRFDAFKCNWTEGMENKPHIFWDSDVAKWIEGVSYSIMNGCNTELQSFIDELVTLIGKNRRDDGYFNSYYNVCEKDSRFTNRDNHELYCTGHLIEAAIAYKHATGKDEFLGYMIDYINYIYKVFVEDKSAAFSTPGHQEIELALIRLYEETGNEKYLELSEFFIEKRGREDNKKDYVEDETFEKRAVFQSHLPVREQKVAVGHSVRACYMYCAMADLARINGDEGMLEACRTLFDNIVNKRMYITGGIGSTREGERFTVDYDLPNDEAYAETCASIALAMFSNRMLKIDMNSKYSDIVEKLIYNGIISGVGADGKSFFYENPLEYGRKYSADEKNFLTWHRGNMAIRQRVELFFCSCCPPNVNRFFASVADYLYSEDDDTVYVHQYMDSETELDGERLYVNTCYPGNGKINIKYDGKRKIAVRKPGWCKNALCDVSYELRNGYMYFDKACEINIEFEMNPMLMSAASKNEADSGCVAVMRGPVVYCAEAVDNGENLGDLYILAHGSITEEDDKLSGLKALYVDGVRRKYQSELYREFDIKCDKCSIRMIPYFRFANRGDTEMRVWLNVSL